MPDQRSIGTSILGKNSLAQNPNTKHQRPNKSQMKKIPILKASACRLDSWLLNLDIAWHLVLEVWSSIARKRQKGQEPPLGS
jgi:hypothetical protein